jgi:transposase
LSRDAGLFDSFGAVKGVGIMIESIVKLCPDCGKPMDRQFDEDKRQIVYIGTIKVVDYKKRVSDNCDYNRK